MVYELYIEIQIAVTFNLHITLISAHFVTLFN